MNKRFLLLSLIAGGVALGAQAQYQVENSGFENWESVGKGVEPNNWNSFLSATGSVKGFAQDLLSKDTSTFRPGSKGKISAKIHSAKVWGKNAQGNLTTGCINMGSITPSDATGNYNYTRKEQTGQCMPFTGRPDSMKVWVKFTPINSSDHAKVVTILHADGYYQDPINPNKAAANLVGEAVKTDVSSSDWKELSIPFTYNSNEKPAYALVSFATNKEAGKGGVGDVMWIDDLSYVYNSELKSFTLSGQIITIPAADGTTDCSQLLYDDAQAVFTSNGQGATIEKVYDRATGLLTVTVKGNDWTDINKNEHIYKFQFKKGEQPNYTETLVVIVDGTPSSVPVKQGIFMKKNASGNYDLSIKDFSLVAEHGSTLVGDIILKDVPAKDVNGQLQYNTFQETQITSTTPDALGNLLGIIPISFKGRTINGKLWASLQIDLRESPLQQLIVVTIGDAPTVNGKDVTGVNHNNVVCLDYSMGSEVNINEMAADVTKADLEEVAATQLQNCVVYNPTFTGKNVVNTTTNACESFSLTDTKEGFSIQKEVTVAKLDYDRGFNTTPNYVSSFVLPYAMSPTDVKGDVYVFDGVSGDKILFKKATTIAANTPYLIVANDPNPFPTTNVKLEVTPATMEVVKGNYAHVGSFTTQEVASDAATSYYGYAGGKFVKALTGTLKPFRTMIKAMSVAAAPAQFSLKLGNEVTGIIGVNSEIGKVNVYNLEGKLVRSQVEAATALQGLEKGVYVINGQKVVK